MIDQYYNDGDTFTINYKKIISDKTMLPVTRLLAADLTMTPYMTVGTFFKNIKDADLDTLREVMEDSEDEHYGEIILITEMLTRAEGVETQTDKFDDFLSDLTNRVKIFSAYIALEYLARTGHIIVERQHMSFGEEHLDSIVARPNKNFDRDDDQEEI